MQQLKRYDWDFLLSGREGGMPRDGEKIFLGSRQKSLESVGNENITEEHVFQV